MFKLNVERGLQALPRNTSTEEVTLADASTLQVSNQKNGHKVACVHHTANKEHPKEFPVRSLGKIIFHIRKDLKPRKDVLFLYWYEVGRASATDSDIRLAVKCAA